MNNIRLPILYQSKLQRYILGLSGLLIEGRESSFCEKDLVHKYCKLECIAMSLFMIYMDLVTKRVEDVGKSLPTTYGLILVGWSSGSIHYLAMFACFLRGCPLLVVSLLLNEEDLNAESHVFISSTLHVINSTISNVYIVGDNCNLNRAIAITVCSSDRVCESPIQPGSKELFERFRRCPGKKSTIWWKNCPHQRIGRYLDVKQSWQRSLKTKQDVFLKW